MPISPLKQEVSAQSVRIYHRSGKHNDNYDLSTDPSGFESEHDAFYGAGVYAALYEKGMNTPEMVGRYGTLLIESKVLSIEGFLIFQPQIAKVVFGRDFSIQEQIARLFGKNLKSLQSDQNEAMFMVVREMQTLDELLAKEGPGGAAKGLRLSCPHIFGKAKGIIADDPQQGPILVAHNKHNVVPVRYKVGEGGEWKIVNGGVAFYQKVREFYAMKRKTFSAGENRNYPADMKYDKPAWAEKKPAVTNQQKEPALA